MGSGGMNMKQSAEHRAQSAEGPRAILCPLPSALCLLVVVVFLIVPLAAHAEHRISIEPSIEVSEVHDDNLNFSDEEPLRDRIRRITPTLALRFESPRWSARGTYGVDSENFASHSDLDNARARERASIGLQYVAGPRLSLSLSGGYVDTNTLAELNVETGLAASRVRARQLSVSPAARWTISPRLAAVAAASSITTNVVNGVAMRAQVQKLAFERRLTPRDRFSVAYEHSHLAFDDVQTDDVQTTEPVRTQALLAGWSRDITARTHLLLSVGPRVTNGSPTTDLSASMTHSWRFSSLALSALRGQTTVIGQAGVVETQSVQARFTYEPHRRLSAYASPAVIRSTQQHFQASVYRIGLGARYTVTPLVDFDVAYTLDKQKGAIDPLRADDDFSHATLSVGFVTRWNSADRNGTGRLR
jgi:hypothetical protein